MSLVVVNLLILLRCSYFEENVCFLVNQNDKGSNTNEPLRLRGTEKNKP